MNASAGEVRGTVVPTLRYRDVPAAIEWLCTAFGFEKHLVVDGEGGSVRYAQLTFGDGMIMLGPIEDSGVNGLMVQPEQMGGLETQICYLFVDDARAHCGRAKAAGAAIVLDIDDETSDGRGYSCRDPEGHIWNFGTYDPRQRASVRRPPPPTPMQAGVRRLALAIGMLANAVTSVAFLGWLYAASEHAVSVAHASVPRHSTMTADRSSASQEMLERTVRESRELLAREKAARETAERAAREVRELLAREKSAKEQAERTAAEIRDLLAKERSAKAAQEPATGALRAALEKAEQVAEEARTRLREVEAAAQKTRDEAAQLRSSRELAERAAAEAKDQLVKERSARELAERAAKVAREQAAKAPPRKAAPAPKPPTQSGGFSLFQ